MKTHQAIQDSPARLTVRLLVGSSTVRLMQGWTLGIALFGAVVATASLTWNVVQFLLGGARPKAHLVVGAISPTGGGLITHPPTATTSDLFARLAEQGYTRPVIGVTVVNHGRAPTRVQKWTVKCLESGVTYLPVAESVGPNLPHDLAAQANETWVVDFHLAYALVHTTASTFKRRPAPVHVTVELGIGKTLVSKESLLIPNSQEA